MICYLSNSQCIWKRESGRKRKLKNREENFSLALLRNKKKIKNFSIKHFNQKSWNELIKQINNLLTIPNFNNCGKSRIIITKKILQNTTNKFVLMKVCKMSEN